MPDIVNIIFEAIKQFGFPVVVAAWALWRLDKSLSSEGITQARLEQIEESLDRIELTLSKSAEIQQETLLTIKILHTLLTAGDGGDKKWQ